MKKYLSRYLFLMIVLLISGCTTAPPEYFSYDYPEINRTGTYHKVRKGETIWRIAKSYNVPIDEIIRSNRIPNVAQIEENQLILIPGASAAKHIYIDMDDKKDEFVWPVKGRVISYFHDEKDGRLNKGIDIKCEEGTAVKATRTGKVVFADYMTGYNHTVILDHDDGFYSVYSQNSKLLVKLGDLVFKNEQIARVGRNDRLAFLHFQIRKNFKESNPLHYLP